jgi:hypothetical protein
VTKEPWFKPLEGREVFDFNSDEFKQLWPDIRQKWSMSVLGK